ncbi:MAG: hypothetical protein WCG92_09730, partial [Hyphomicrobiales bacterium]
MLLTSLSMLKSPRPGILSMKIALEEIRLSNRAPLSCNEVSVHGFLTRWHPSHAIAGGDTPDRGGSA